VDVAVVVVCYGVCVIAGSVAVVVVASVDGVGVVGDGADVVDVGDIGVCVVVCIRYSGVDVCADGLWCVCVVIVVSGAVVVGVVACDVVVVGVVVVVSVVVVIGVIDGVGVAVFWLFVLPTVVRVVFAKDGIVVRTDVVGVVCVGVVVAVWYVSRV